MTIRSRRTNINIQQAFIDLLQTQVYETITMSDIAHQATCHRTTVHRHYSNKRGLLLACFETTVEAIKDELIYPRETSDQSASQIAYANILTFYTHVANNQALYRALFNTDAGGSIRIRFRRFVAGVVLNAMGQEGSLKNMTIPTSIVGNLLGDMVVGAMIWWLESDSTFDPTLLAEIVLRMAETGFFGLTGQVAAEGDISFTAFPASWAKS